MRGLPISSSNPVRLLLLISPDTAAKRQGWGLVTHPRDPAPTMTQTTKLPLPSCKADSLCDVQTFL